MRLVGALCSGVTLSACSFIQPSNSRAPIADVVGAGIMTAGDAALLATEPNYREDKNAVAGVCILSSLAFLYVASAVYGFAQDPETQEPKPILGLQILAAGLAGFGAAASQSNQGCCSYHGGITDSCSANGHLLCQDGAESPSCVCK